MIENLHTAPPSVLLIGLVVTSVYFGIGVLIGIGATLANLARFHGAGFMWGRMAKYIAIIALVWPVALVELVLG